MRTGTGYEEDQMMQQMDPDVEEILKKKDDLEDDTGEVKGERNDTTSNMKAKAAESVADDDIPSAIPPTAAGVDTKNKIDRNSTGVFNNKTHPLSTRFNASFFVEANDHSQADAILSPELKHFLLEHPQFFIDFQEDQIMVYREYTLEPNEYSLALDLGKRVLGSLPANLTLGKKQKR